MVFDPPGVHAGAAATYLDAVASGRLDDAVVIAVGKLLVRDGAAHRVDQYEHIDLEVIALGQRAG